MSSNKRATPVPPLKAKKAKVDDLEFKVGRGDDWWCCVCRVLLWLVVLVALCGPCVLRLCVGACLCEVLTVRSCCHRWIRTVILRVAHRTSDSREQFVCCVSPHNIHPAAIREYTISSRSIPLSRLTTAYLASSSALGRIAAVVTTVVFAAACILSCFVFSGVSAWSTIVHE